MTENYYYAVCDMFAVYGVGDDEELAIRDAQIYFTGCHEDINLAGIIRGGEIKGAGFYVVKIDEAIYSKHIGLAVMNISLWNECVFDESAGVYRLN